MELTEAVQRVQERVGEELDHFEAGAVADALRREVAFSIANGLPTITINMTLADALAMAEALEA